MTEEEAAKCLEQLRAHGNDAHLHPVTRQLAVWYAGAWWYVVGGDFERPSLRRAKEQPPGPFVPRSATRKTGFYWIELQIRSGPAVVEKRVAWWMAGLWWMPGDAEGHYDNPIFRVLSGPLEPPA